MIAEKGIRPVIFNPGPVLNTLDIYWLLLKDFETPPMVCLYSFQSSFVGRYQNRCPQVKECWKKPKVSAFQNSIKILQLKLKKSVGNTNFFLFDTSVCLKLCSLFSPRSKTIYPDQDALIMSLSACKLQERSDFSINMYYKPCHMYRHLLTYGNCRTSWKQYLQRRFEK